MREFGVKGATDVTGFALLGHAWEMACASKVTIEVEAARVPMLEGALELVAAGMLTSGDKTNREYIGADVEISQSVDEEMRHLLFDPQTAGGMLISIPAIRADQVLVRLRENYPRAELIGRVVEKEKYSIRVK
jgi:selenide,water dikinase